MWNIICSNCSACILKWFISLFTCHLQQLRHLCKTYGVRAFISTENARNSLYRVSVNFVLDYCARYMRHNFHHHLIIVVFVLLFLPNQDYPSEKFILFHILVTWFNLCSIPDLSSSIEINGEGVREFIAGFSDNLGLDSYHAARMVSAAVAARTRSKILQAWVC